MVYHRHQDIMENNHHHPPQPYLEGIIFIIYNLWENCRKTSLLMHSDV